MTGLCGKLIRKHPQCGLANGGPAEVISQGQTTPQVMCTECLQTLLSWGLQGLVRSTISQASPQIHGSIYILPCKLLEFGKN